MWKLKLQTYDLVDNYYWDDYRSEMEAHDDGEWVSAYEARAEIERLEDENQRLKLALLETLYVHG